MPCALRATINEEDCLNSPALREAKKWLISALRLRRRIQRIQPPRRILNSSHFLASKFDYNIVLPPLECYLV